MSWVDKREDDYESDDPEKFLEQCDSVLEVVGYIRVSETQETLMNETVCICMYVYMYVCMYAMIYS